MIFLQYKTCSCASQLQVFVSTAAKRFRLVSRLYYIYKLQLLIHCQYLYLSIFSVVKTMCVCSEINCSPVKFCGGVIVKHIHFCFHSRMI